MTRIFQIFIRADDGCILPVPPGNGCLLHTHIINDQILANDGLYGRRIPCFPALQIQMYIDDLAFASAVGTGLNISYRSEE